MERCKRNTVYAYADGVCAINLNEGVCTGVRRQCGCNHAEIMLLRKISNPKVILVSRSPCVACARRLISAGVESVYYRTLHSDGEGIKLLESNGVYVAHNKLSMKDIYK